MDITPVIPDGKQLIEGYSEAGFRISGTLHSGSVLVCDNAVWPLGVDTLAELMVESFLPLLQLDTPPTLILLGTGATQQFAPPALRTALRAHALTIESMTSAAACRTYNVLLAEGRLVAAALLPLLLES